MLAQYIHHSSQYSYLATHVHPCSLSTKLLACVINCSVPSCTVMYKVTVCGFMCSVLCSRWGMECVVSVTVNWMFITWAFQAHCMWSQHSPISHNSSCDPQTYMPHRSHPYSDPMKCIHTFSTHSNFELTCSWPTNVYSHTHHHHQTHTHTLTVIIMKWIHFRFSPNLVDLILYTCFLITSTAIIQSRYIVKWSRHARVRVCVCVCVHNTINLIM